MYVVKVRELLGFMINCWGFFVGEYFSCDNCLGVWFG